MTKEKSLIKIEEYRQIIEKRIPYLKVKGVSMSFESYVRVENNEISWSRIKYELDVVNFNYVIFSFIIWDYIKNPNEVSTPDIIFEYKKDWSNTKKMLIFGKMNNDKNNNTKSIDEQLEIINEIIIKRKLLK